jgi:hypothetical protein
MDGARNTCGRDEAYKILVGGPEEKRPLGRPRDRWDDNMRMDLRKIGWECVKRLCLALDKDY